MPRVVRAARIAFATCLVSCLIAAPSCALTQAPAPRPPRRFVIGIDPATVAVWRIDAVTRDRWLGGAGVSLRGGYVFSERTVLLLDASMADVRIDGVNWELFSMDVLLRRRDPRAFVGGRLGWFADVGGTMFDGTRDSRPVTGAVIDQWTGPGLAAGVGLTWRVRECWLTVLGMHGERGVFDDHRVGMTTTHGLRTRVESVRFTLGLDLSPRGTC